MNISSDSENEINIREKPCIIKYSNLLNKNKINRFTRKFCK